MCRDSGVLLHRNRRWVFFVNGTSEMTAESDVISQDFAFHRVISEISSLNWQDLTEEQVVDSAWAYYYFSVQFRENLQVTRFLLPDDPKIADLEREECATDNLSPWPGVAAAGEAMDHDEFMRRTLLLAPIDRAKRERFQALGERYLELTRSMDDATRALSIASYEDGGLETVFRAMLRAPAYDNKLIAAFRHFLAEHIRFDSDPEAGHGAMSRHLRPDDRILPLWQAFKQLYVDFIGSGLRPAA